ncbi:37S ribosomal protein S9, mitochondrial [Psilocybe cubensis]|uniref:37S ribosomal protein S9, mitochondrial n=2 Tax=Psilocybe cubensis TaxID=181762 RepID=A0ACB8HB16_PSICU|nr:37S ribosomal protein S9, mitochondrial [Psilocybe cubensis]KAH9485123.1 37S ribosomal protein S9, mitochondrial [Psilocybe cubensis]
MNFLKPRLLRQATRFTVAQSQPCHRLYATAAPRSEHSDGFSPQLERTKPIPQSPSFYTTRAVYYDQIMFLEKAIGSTETFLRQNHLLPLPDFARASLPPVQPVWKDQEEMALELKTKMTTTRYRKVTKLLNQLIDFERIAATGGCAELSRQLREILELYESSKKEAFLARGKRKVVKLDMYGRSYTVGKRKTSSARVWMIPVQLPATPTEQAEGEPTDAKAAETSAGSPKGSKPAKPVHVTTTTILVNNMPLNQYFAIPADRERITRPFKVAGVLGKYNVFAIVRGGGISGQAGALAHGIAKAIVAHEPDREVMFRRAKLTYRDPRMVERKKTGRRGARSAYTWVKR